MVTLGHGAPFYLARKVVQNLKTLYMDLLRCGGDGSMTMAGFG